jgi:hypothetical protein
LARQLTAALPAARARAPPPLPALRVVAARGSDRPRALPAASALLFASRGAAPPGDAAAAAAALAAAPHTPHHDAALPPPTPDAAAAEDQAQEEEDDDGFGVDLSRFGRHTRYGNGTPRTLARGWLHLATVLAMELVLLVGLGAAGALPARAADLTRWTSVGFYGSVLFHMVPWTRMATYQAALFLDFMTIRCARVRLRARRGRSAGHSAWEGRRGGGGSEGWFDDNRRPAERGGAARRGAALGARTRHAPSAPRSTQRTHAHAPRSLPSHVRPASRSLSCARALRFLRFSPFPRSVGFTGQIAAWVGLASLPGLVSASLSLATLAICVGCVRLRCAVTLSGCRGRVARAPRKARRF